MAVILISHHLSVVRATCGRVLVLRQGRVVESGNTADVFSRPRHPYTRQLLRAIPLPDVDPTWIDKVTADELLDG